MKITIELGSSEHCLVEWVRQKDADNALLAEGLVMLDLDARTKNCCSAHGIKTVRQLTEHSEEDLLGVIDLGSRSVTKIKLALASRRLALRAGASCPACGQRAGKMLIPRGYGL